MLSRRPGRLILPSRALLHLDTSLKPTEAVVVAQRLQSAAREIGLHLQLSRRRRREETHISLVRRETGLPVSPPASSREGYTLTIDRHGVLIEFAEVGGLRVAVATLRQLLREYGRRLPCLHIRDWPDFSRRGVMLDVSRGRVPRLETLLQLVEDLADFKINEFQLYLEHTFAYRNYRPVWRGWGALTGKEIMKLDGRCRELGIDLVPNQNSFGHLRQWLAHPPLKRLAEVAAPYPDPEGGFLRHPSTLAPSHPGTLPFLRGLYDELLPNFSSRYFNVGCDETWDLGRGQSSALCRKRGKGRVYLEFLKQIHAEARRHGRQMMVWGDMVLHHPRLVRELPEDVIVLNWGYEADHPFRREAGLFSKSGVPFYVCPGTSTWMTLIGRHDNALANLRAAARAGREHGARGYLLTDWGDGGHPQPLAVSYLPYLAGAALSWCAKSFDEKRLVPVLSRDIFHDPTGRLAGAALALGVAHRQLRHTELNGTPLGTTIAAPPPKLRELFCRNGLKHYRSITAKRVRAALTEVERQRAAIRHSRPQTRPGRLLASELDLAARMAGESCKFMLWQQTLAAGRMLIARQMARAGIRELRKLVRDFNAGWPARNKGATSKCSAFLHWRIEDYSRGISPAAPKQAGVDQG
jgi:hexosaminidase